MRPELERDIKGEGQRGSGDFLPALAHPSLTPYYDRLLRWTTREDEWRTALLDQVVGEVREGGRVLDIACGTGTFTLALARRRRDLDILGLDADEEVLALAAGKSSRVRSSVRWQRSRAERLPFRDGSFDAVTTSLFFHHLAPEAKTEVAREIRRVLAPGGAAHVADWTTPRGALASAGFLLVQLLDGFATTADHRRGRLPSALARGGLVGIELTATHDVPLGSIGIWRARPENL